MINSWINAEVELPTDKSLYGRASKDVIIKMSDDYKRINNISFEGNYLIGQYWFESECFRTGIYLPNLRNFKGLQWQYCK